MSSAKALLERAAICMDTYVVSENDERIAKLMALHIINRVGAKACDEQAKLLMELCDEPQAPL